MSQKKSGVSPAQTRLDFDPPRPVADSVSPPTVLEFEVGRRAAAKREEALIEKLLLDQAAKLSW